MKEFFKNKDFITKLAIIVGIIMCLLSLTGCNKQVFDFEYTYDKAICIIGNETKEIKIKKWTDYDDGEQIQIIDKEGNVYLVSSMNCTLIKED